MGKLIRFESLLPGGRRVKGFACARCAVCGELVELFLMKPYNGKLICKECLFEEYPHDLYRRLWRRRRKREVKIVQLCTKQR